MTTMHKPGAGAVDSPMPSTLPFDPAGLVAMRVLPAQFARMVGVSKQAVSQWVKRGIVTIGPDGKLDPAIASRQVIERTDPAKLRARVFKQATATHDEMRARIRALEHELASEREWAGRREEAAGYRADEGASRSLVRTLAELAARFDEACEAHKTGRLTRWLDELAVVAFYGQDLDEYRRDFPEDEADTDADPEGASCLG